MRKRRREPSAAVREAETALVRALENVVRGIERLQNQVREDGVFLRRLLDDGISPRAEECILKHLSWMEQRWPELFKQPKGD